MWELFFSVLSFIVLIAGLIWNRRRFEVRGEQLPSQLDHGERYQFTEQTDDESRIAVKTQLRFTVPRHVRFSLSRERGLDRLAKKLGLVTELEFGDDAFDRRFFIEDEGALRELLGTRKDLRAALRGLAVRLNSDGARVDWIAARDGHLDVQVNTGDRSGQPAKLRAECVAYLQPLLDALRTSTPDPAAGVDSIRLAVLPRAIVLAAMLGGFGGAMLLLVLAPDRLLDPWLLARSAPLPGVIAFFVFLFWATRRVGPTPLRHRLLMEWVLAGVPSFIAATALLMREANIMLDFAPAESVTATNGELSIGEHDYRLRFRTEHPAFDRSHLLRVDASTFRDLAAAWNGTKSERFALKLHRGALGFAWVDADP